MVNYIARRLLVSLLVILLVTVFVFTVMHSLPGDPLLLFLGDEASVSNLAPGKMDELRHEYGLDKPLPVQYLTWMWNITHGDFGTSLFYRDKVGKIILERLPVTVHLGIAAFTLSAFMGILVGVVSGVRRGKWIDTATTVIAYLGVATPSFWLGILMIYLFGFQLRLIPIAGYTSPFVNFWMSTKQAILPVICLSISGFAVTARQVRSSMIEVIQRDYIRTARSKGLKESDVVFGHALKNSLIPVVTVVGMNVRHIIGGSVVIESVFAIPGIGRLLVDGIMAHDYQVVQSMTLIVGVIIVLSNLAVDMSYAWLDPRIRYD